jgi:opacity protein-like surface antigen
MASYYVIQDGYNVLADQRAKENHLNPTNTSDNAQRRPPMTKFTFLALVLFSSVASAYAQADNKPEFFAGYSYENVNSGITNSNILATGITQTSLENRFHLNGFNLSGTASFKKRLGIVGDFSAHFDKRNDSFDTLTTGSKFRLYNVTAGPQFTFSSMSRFTPFTHALFGIAHRNLTETLSDGTNYFTDSSTNFAMNLGGGVDYKLSDRFGLRLFQLDYNPIFLRSRTINSTVFPRETLNGIRFSAGIVIR